MQLLLLISLSLLALLDVLIELAYHALDLVSQGRQFVLALVDFGLHHPVENQTIEHKVSHC